MAALDEESEGLAAEYALGTLSAEERLIARSRLVADPEFARAVADWERRLAPLADAVPERAPNAALFEAINARSELRAAPSDDAGSDTSNIVELRRKLTRWRAATIGLGALAASLLVVLGLPIEPGREFVAVLQSESAGPGFVATVDTAHHVMTVRRVGAPAPTDYSYELWALGAGRPKAQSLGVIEASARMPAEKLGPHDLSDTTLAISLEPPGGSPTGQATGPVLFVGKLLPAE